MVRKYEANRRPAPEVTIVGSSQQEDADESNAAVSSGNVEVDATADIAGSVKVQLYGVSARCSFSQVHNVIQLLDDCKKRLVREIGFGGFLHFPCIKSMDRKFVAWLMCRVDPLSQTLHIDEKHKLEFRKEDVAKVFGIPVGGIDVSSAGRPSNDNVSRIMTDFLGLKPKDNRSIRYMQEVITRDYGGAMSEVQCASFKVAFVIYLMSTVLAPRAKYDNAAADYWGALLDPDEIGCFDWSEYVLRQLMDAVIKMKKDLSRSTKLTNITGCSLFLQVLYLDSMDFGVLTMEHNSFPRIKPFSADRVKSMIRLDTFGSTSDREGGRYGKTKLRATNGVCYYWASCCVADCSENLSCTHGDLWQACISLARLLHFPSGAVHAIYNLVVQSGTKGGFAIMSGILSLAEQYSSTRKRSHHFDNTDAGKVVETDPLEPAQSLTISLESQGVEISCPRCKRTRMEAEDPDGVSVTQFHDSVNDGRNVGFRDVGFKPYDGASSSGAGVQWQEQQGGFDDLIEKLTSSAHSCDGSGPFLMHPFPKYIEVLDEELQNQLAGKCEIEVDTFDAVLRCFNHREAFEYSLHGSVKRRHYVENDFMISVLDGNVHRLASGLKGFFMGEHVNYDVSACELFFFPARILNGWICFCWQSYKNLIYVFDPLYLVDKYVNALGIGCDIVHLLQDAVVNFGREVGFDWLQRIGLATAITLDVGEKFARQNCSGVVCAYFCRNYEGSGKFHALEKVDMRQLVDTIASDILLLRGDPRGMN